MGIRQGLLRWLGQEEAPPAVQGHDLLASLLVMAWMIEARDPYTGGHLWRVSRFAELLAERAGLTDLQIACAAVGGFLHDLGKIGVPDAILRKPASLTEAEYDLVRTHPAIGERVLAAHPLAGLVRDAVACHHERPDGLGYPRGLHGQDIPLVARIVSIGDAFDAMTSTRPYRRGMSIDDALAIISDARGSQFDDTLVGDFLSLKGTGALEHIVGYSDDGIPLQTCVMCGPTLALTAMHGRGDLIHCRSCGSEYRLIDEELGSVGVVPTGKTGTAAQLTPVADIALIARTVRDAASRAAFGRLLERPHVI
ncbi:HD-GYP domain-containing protein [Rhodocyclaceae bacterium SMB388]